MIYRILIEEIRMFDLQKILAISIIVSLFSVSSSFAAPNYNYTQTQMSMNQQNNYGYQQPMTYNNTPLRGSVVTVPSGATFSAGFMSPLSSTSAFPGQPVSLVLGNDFYYNDKLIAPAGSTVSGNVIEASAAKHGSLNGKLLVRFTQIITPVGMQIPISAIIKTDDNTGVLVGGTKTDVAKEYTKDVAIGTATGALSGLVFGALAGGNVGKGAALGTAVGAGGGLVKSAWDKGADVEIPANSSIELMLTQPITTSSLINYSFEN